LGSAAATGAIVATTMNMARIVARTDVGRVGRRG
jgi:hypothetical protein